MTTADLKLQMVMQNELKIYTFRTLAFHSFGYIKDLFIIYMNNEQRYTSTISVQQLQSYCTSLKRLFLLVHPVYIMVAEKSSGPTRASAIINPIDLTMNKPSRIGLPYHPKKCSLIVVFTNKPIRH